MRFGGPVFGWQTPEEWIAKLRDAGYRTAYCPIDENTPDDRVEAFLLAAREADITIAEVGVWRNVMTHDEAVRRENIEFAKRRLALADRVGARCAVNISGNRGEQWDGPDPANLLPETLDKIVATVREIVDAVRPTRAKYSLETMPYMVPDSTESALEVVRAVDREMFGIHYDPINIVTSPRHYYATGHHARDFIAQVGPHITAIHLKDITLRGKLTVHLDEVRPGLGSYDLAALLRAVNAGLDADMPVLLEHLPDESEYDAARAHVMELAEREGIRLE
ncbi:MAG: sugar phosphate isomerase/epimerase family protein [Fimbriimonas sp.]